MGANLPRRVFLDANILVAIGLRPYNSRDFAALYGQTICGVFVRHSADFMRAYVLQPPREE